MSATHSGSCLCGAVRFEISGEFQGFFLCHCKRCRKTTGAANAANLFSSTATLAWLSGEDKLRTYQVAGTRFAKSFCADCSSALPIVQQTTGRLLVPAGSLDSELTQRPDAHIFCASRAAWDERLEEVASFDERPG